MVETATALNRNPINLSREIKFGFLVIFMFFGLVFAWASVAPLSSAAIAPGVVTVEGYRKTIQHLEGGIVRNILVKDGDSVSVGQVLIELESLPTETDFQLLSSQRVIAAAKESRLNAEYALAQSIEFPEWLIKTAETSPEVANIIAGQERIFKTRLDLYATHEQNLRDKMSEATRELKSYQAKGRALKKQHEIVKNEIEEYEDLIERGLITRRQLFSLKEQLAKIEADTGQNNANQASTQQRVGQYKAQLEEHVFSQKSAIAVELRETRDELIEIEHLTTKAKDKLDRTVIRAPIAGDVVNLKVYTAGGVIEKGAPLLDIVPSNERLVVEARLDPKDRDLVHAGLESEVRFSAFNQRNYRPVSGEVRTISADSLVDTITNEPYYLATVELTENPETALDGMEIKPGMQAEVMILTGERTAMDYFIGPLLASFNRAMREK